MKNTIFTVFLMILIISSTLNTKSQSDSDFILINDQELGYNNILNQSTIEVISPNSKEISELTKYNANVEVFPETSNFSVYITIEYIVPDFLSQFRINHHLLSWTSSLVNPSIRDSLVHYPDGFVPMIINYTKILIDGEINEYSLHDSYILINLTENLEQNQLIELTFEFTANIPESKRRLGKTVDINGDVLFSLPYLFPLIPVYENGKFITNSFDEIGESFYSESSYFNVNVTAPEDFVVGGTGSIIAESTTLGKTTTSFEAFPVREWALIGSFAYVKESLVLELETHDVSVHSLYLPQYNAFHDQDEFAGRAIEYFSSLFGDYPYSDYTSAQSIGFYGGMEFPTISFINSTSNSHDVDRISAHEVGHQWNWVMLGNDEAKEGWLDEGITSYFTSLYLLNYGYLSQSDLEEQQISVLVNVAELGLYINQTIYDPITEFERSIYYFSAYVYMPKVMQQLEYTIGKDLFHLIMKNYYSKYRFETVSAVDLITHIGHQLDQNWPNTYFNEFLNIPGLPSVNTSVIVKYFTSNQTMLQITVVSEPNVIQRMKLLIEFLDDEENPMIIENSIILNGTTTFDWLVDTSNIDRIRVGGNGGALADFNVSTFFGSIIYQGIEETTISSPQLSISTTEETSFLSFELVFLVAIILSIQIKRKGRLF